MSLSRAVGAVLLLTAIDQAVRGMVESRLATLSPLAMAGQAICLSAALLLLAYVARREERVALWQVLIAAGCLGALLERAFFGSVSLPFALASKGEWDWTAFAFADMYIAAGIAAAYWKYEFKRDKGRERERQPKKGEGVDGHEDQRI